MLLNISVIYLAYIACSFDYLRQVLLNLLKIYFCDILFITCETYKKCLVKFYKLSFVFVENFILICSSGFALSCQFLQGHLQLYLFNKNKSLK